MKTVDYYMSLPYKIELYPDVEEGGYAVSCPELPGCLSCGETIEECIENIEDAKRVWITATLEDWKEEKREIPNCKKRLFAYTFAFSKCQKQKQDNINIIQDEKGYSIVIINDIRFFGKQNIEWKTVEQYLREYVGKCYEIIETSDKVYIGKEFPDEFKGSDDTKRLKGGNAKAKANASGKIPQLLEYATNRRWSKNHKGKHGIDAKKGWYRYTSRFALPIYSNDGDLIRYNIFRIEMLVRYASDDRLYLYDMVNVKKETEYPA